MPEGVGETSMPWRYSVAAGYETPAQPASEKVKTGLSSFCRRFWLGKTRASNDEAGSESRPLSDLILANVSPEPHWEAAATGLAACLDSWLHEPAPKSLVQAVIGPPGSGVQEVVARWGKQVSANVLSPPDHAEIIDPDSDYWQAVARDDEGVLVIPALERFYLRHSDGLDLIRQLTEWLWSSPRRVVVGCDSWAWAYLCKTVRIEAVFRAPIALESLDGDALRAWLRPRPRGRYLVRAAWSGETIYPTEVAEDAARRPNAAVAEDEEPRYKGADIFQRIAAMSRGIPEVALALWRKCLCEGEAEEASETTCLSTAGTPTLIQVRPPQSLNLPSLPPDASTLEAIVLHTLLLHAGLPSSILCRVVPFPASDVIATLAVLRDAELILEYGQIWKVAPLGYPGVRAFVRAETLLIDLF